MKINLSIYAIILLVSFSFFGCVSSINDPNSITITPQESNSVPYAPYGLALTQLSASSYNISWKDSSAGKISYQVWRKIDSGDFLLFDTTQIGANNINDETIIPGKVYYYKVRGNNTFGFSPFSYYLNTLGSGNSEDILAPTLTYGWAASSKSIILIWKDNSSNENYFSIERKTIYTDYSRIGVVVRNSTTFKDSGLTPGTEYIYRIKAYSYKDSSWSNEFYITTFLTDLSAPTILSITNPSSYKVVLTWKDNDSFTAKWAIERKDEPGGSFNQIAEVESGLTSFDDLSIVPDKTYTYRIRCYNSDSFSQYSNEVIITTVIR